MAKSIQKEVALMDAIYAKYEKQMSMSERLEVQKIKLEYDKLETAQNAEVIKAGASVASALVGALGKYANTRQLVKANERNIAYEMSGHVFTTTTGKNMSKGITDDLIKSGIM